jgi:hypothetical protein
MITNAVFPSSILMSTQFTPNQEFTPVVQQRSRLRIIPLAALLTSAVASLSRSQVQFPGSTPDPLQLGQQIFLNSGSGSGTINCAAWLGFNEGFHSGDPVQLGAPGLMMGFEDNYFDVSGDLTYAKEWYVEGWSPDGTTVQMSRPFYARGSQLNDGTDWWVIVSNIGTTGDNRQFTVREGAANLFSVMPNGITMRAPTTVLGYFASAGPGAGVHIRPCLTDSPARRNWALIPEANVVGDLAIRCSATNGCSLASLTMLELTGTGKVGIGGVTSPNATLDINGNLATAIRTGGTATLGETDSTYLVNVDGQTVTLPTAVLGHGRCYTIKAIAPADGAIVATTGNQVIDGAPSYSIVRSNQFVTVQSDGSNWWIIGAN